MTILSLSILLAAKTKIEMVLALFAACWLFYFNSAGYFLNYEGVVHYYTISYPNYFYLGLCIEFITFGFILAWRYKETLTKNFILLTEHSKHKSELLEREIEIQERERKQIASDLHDDLGATISAIKLIVSNSYANDEHLIKMVNKASKDIRVFSSTFSAVDIHEGLFITINSRISELNALGIMKFQFIDSGDESAISQELKISTF
jgi:signal transduction histidine kinase